jgi:hypothetical protein
MRRFELLLIFYRMVAAVSPQAKLDYATYVGTSLAAGVNQFLGMRFASPPLGNRRWRAPADPMAEPSPVQAFAVRQNRHFSPSSPLLTNSADSTVRFATTSELPSIQQQPHCPKTVCLSTFTPRLAPPRPPSCRCGSSSRGVATSRTRTRIITALV